MSEEDSLIYYSLSRRSQLCLKRVKWKQGRSYNYNPRSHLLTRLSVQFGFSREEARTRLLKIRDFVTAHPQYY